MSPSRLKLVYHPECQCSFCAIHRGIYNLDQLWHLRLLAITWNRSPLRAMALAA